MQDHQVFVLIMTLGVIFLTIALFGIIAYTCILNRRVDMSDRMMINIADAMKHFITTNANVNNQLEPHV